MPFFAPEMALTSDMRTAAHGLGVCVAALVGIGLVMVFSVSAAEGAAEGCSPGAQLVKRSIWIAVAVMAFYAASRVNLAWLEEQRVLLLCVAVFMLLLVLLPWVGTARFGARRWIRMGPVGVQPSELAKLLLLVFVAGYAKEHRRALHTFKRGLLIPGLVIGVVCGLVFLEPDFGTAMLLGFVSVAVLLIAGACPWQVALLSSSALPLLGVMIWLSPARWKRIVAFLHPEEYSSGAAYQMIQAVVALGSGGLFGTGVGAGGQKYGFLPQSGTDFIFAVIGEEFGLLGTATVIGLFVVLVWLGMKIALRARDMFASLLAAGVVLYVGVQAMIHIAVVTGSAPTKGITLPFISMGGSSLVMCMAGVGLLLAVARRASAEEGLMRTGYGTVLLAKEREGARHGVR